MRLRRGALGLAAVLMVAGCGPVNSTATATDAVSREDVVTVAGRPSSVHVPASYHRGRAVALVIGLRGYSETGLGQEAYLNIAPESDRRGFLCATPDGTKDPESHQFWNATDACCDVT